MVKVDCCHAKGGDLSYTVPGIGLLMPELWTGVLEIPLAFPLWLQAWPQRAGNDINTPIASLQSPFPVLQLLIKKDKTFQRP